MHFALYTLAIAATAWANCSNPSAPPDTGDIALYADDNCSGGYLNVGAFNTCQSWMDFDACSAITRPGVTCDIFTTQGCNDEFVVTVDSTGYRSFCGLISDHIRSVQCFSA
ncbi:hypothetical protein LLEC1_04535 [Akanthomyces lecanii]|uniref:Uncharacterized protein n=1 Tax=Cordyceps confragosa TaxID=2714763 RepID=A0A179IU81_CORDF|nr:hypothetical protein LLEC1_04535 [Akanthomyces lecanii]